MSEPLRVGVVGTGSLGTLVGHQVNRSADARLVAIVEVSSENRATAGEALSVPEAVRYAECETMLEEAGLGAVIIATPHACNYDQTMGALARDGLGPGAEPELYAPREFEDPGVLLFGSRVVLVGSALTHDSTLLSKNGREGVC